MTKRIRAYLLKQDPKLEAILGLKLEFNLGVHGNRFEELAESIVSQQLSGSAASAIRNRINALAKADKFPDPKTILKLKTEDLRKAGLSYAKVAYIKDLAEKTLAGEVEFDKFDQMTDEEIIMELTRVKGIGRWTAHMFLMFALGREDVWAIGDLGLKKGVQKLYNLKKLPDEKKMVTIGKKWIPYRSHVALYLWRSLENR